MRTGMSIFAATYPELLPPSNFILELYRLIEPPNLTPHSYGMEWDVLWLEPCDNLILFERLLPLLHDQVLPAHINLRQRNLNFDPHDMCWIYRSTRHTYTFVYPLSRQALKYVLDQKDHEKDAFG
jgi:hypothetical protein